MSLVLFAVYELLLFAIISLTTTIFSYFSWLFLVSHPSNHSLSLVSCVLFTRCLQVIHLLLLSPPGKSNPYCEVTMGDQIFTSRTLNDTLNPKWNFNCQFHIRDVYQDVLCITIFEKDLFSPDGQLRVCLSVVEFSASTFFFFLGRDKILIFSCWYHFLFWYYFFVLIKCFVSWQFLSLPLGGTWVFNWHCSSLFKEFKVFSFLFQWQRYCDFLTSCRVVSE